MKILIDISDIQRGFSGIVHDLVGQIKILQNFEGIEILFLYIQYNKFSIKSHSQIIEEINTFCKKEGIKNVEIMIKTRWNYYDKFLKFFSIPPSLINTSNFDFVFVQSSFYFRISSNSTLLVRVHDMIYVSHPETISHHFFNKVFFLNTLKFLFHTPKLKILTNSNTTSINLLRYFPNAQNINVLNCPIQLPFSAGIEFPMNIESPYIIFCSTIEPKKNIIFLCELFEEFNLKHPEYSLVIIGKPGWKYKPIVNKVKSTKNVVWLQKVSDNQRDELYKNSKCFVFPSKIEGFGMPPLEAMRSGVPVLSSDIPVHREVQGDCAWFAELGNIQDFLNKLEYILDEKNKTEVDLKVSKSLEWVKKYDPGNMVATWDKILN